MAISPSGVEKSISTSTGAVNSAAIGTPIGPMPATSPASRPWCADLGDSMAAATASSASALGQSHDPLAHAAAGSIHSQFDFVGHLHSACSTSAKTVALSSTASRLFNAA